MVPKNQYSHAAVAWVDSVFSEHKVDILSFRDMFDVSVAHLEQKLFQFEILQFLNVAYFLHIKANFNPKCLDTIKNHAFSNEH